MGGQARDLDARRSPTTKGITPPFAQRLGKIGIGAHVGARNRGPRRSCTPGVSSGIGDRTIVPIPSPNAPESILVRPNATGDGAVRCNLDLKTG
jgi:hypothetical protein